MGDDLDRHIQHLITKREMRLAIQRNEQTIEELRQAMIRLRQMRRDFDDDALGVREPTHPSTPPRHDRIALKEP